MPKTHPAEMERRRRNILQAAKACFQTTGFVGTSVDQICAEAGISKGAFYGHFPTKDAVILAIAASRFDSLDVLNDAKSIDDLRAQMMALITPVAAVGKLEIEVWGQCMRSSEFREIIAQNSEHLRLAVLHLLERLEQGGDLALSIQPTAAATLLLTFLTGAVVQAAINGTPDQDVESALDQVICTIQNPRSKP